MKGILLWGEFCYEGNFIMRGIFLRGVNMGDQYGGSIWEFNMGVQYGGSI